MANTDAIRLTSKTFTADAALTAFSVARIYDDSALVFDGQSIAYMDKPRGVTLGSASIGEPVEVQVVGIIENEAWAFIEGLVYAGIAGALTQSTSGLASTQPIGYATSPTSLILINTTPLPTLAITNVAVVSSSLEMLALSTFETGDIAIRSDVAHTYILQGADYATIGDWVQLPIPTDVVLSVNGLTGVITLTTTEIPEGTNLYYTDARIDAYMASITSLQFSGGTGTQGLMSWNADEETVDLVTNGAVLQLGQEMHIHARNSTGFDIPDGTPVMAVGTLGASGRILIAKMDGSASASAKYLVGITTETIEAGTDGKITTFGKIRGIDTSGTPYGEVWAEGDVLWIDPTTLGGLTNVKPLTGVAMPVAFVISVHASVGTLMIRVTPIDENAYEPIDPNILRSTNFGKTEIDALGIDADTLDTYNITQLARRIGALGNNSATTNLWYKVATLSSIIKYTGNSITILLSQEDYPGQMILSMETRVGITGGLENTQMMIHSRTDSLGWATVPASHLKVIQNNAHEAEFWIKKPGSYRAATIWALNEKYSGTLTWNLGGLGQAAEPVGSLDNIYGGWAYSGDAAKLEGLGSSQFLRSDIAATAAGPITISNTASADLTWQCAAYGTHRIAKNGHYLRVYADDNSIIQEWRNSTLGSKEVWTYATAQFTGTIYEAGTKLSDKYAPIESTIVATGSQIIPANASWVLPPGKYNIVVGAGTGKPVFQIYVSGAWRGLVAAVNGMYYADGSNSMRITEGTGLASVTMYYQRFDI